jgi:addiction module RelE/StbE family toxin
MPRLIYTPRALADMIRLREFIARHNPEAAARMSRILKESAARLKQHPMKGVPVEESPFRDLIILFGASGYILRYRVIFETKTVVVVGIRHGKEDDSSLVV